MSGTDPCRRNPEWVQPVCLLHGIWVNLLQNNWQSLSYVLKNTIYWNAAGDWETWSSAWLSSTDLDALPMESYLQLLPDHSQQYTKPSTVPYCMESDNDCWFSAWLYLGTILYLSAWNSGCGLMHERSSQRSNADLPRGTCIPATAWLTPLSLIKADSRKPESMNC